MVLNKKWSVEFSEKAEKQLTKLDKVIQKQITDYLKKILILPNPRARGEQMKGNLRSYWRYRVGDYRILCQIKDDIITISVVKVAHRREVYATIH